MVDHWFHPHLQLMFYTTCLMQLKKNIKKYPLQLIYSCKDDLIFWFSFSEMILITRKCNCKAYLQNPHFLVVEKKAIYLFIYLFSSSHWDFRNHGAFCRTFGTIGKPLMNNSGLNWFHNVSIYYWILNKILLKFHLNKK